MNLYRTWVEFVKEMFLTAFSLKDKLNWCEKTEEGLFNRMPYEKKPF